MDHCCGNFQFEKVYINEVDLDLCKSHNNRDRRQRNINSAISLKALPENFDVEKYLHQDIGNIEFIHVGNRIYLRCWSKLHSFHMQAR